MERFRSKLKEVVDQFYGGDEFGRHFGLVDIEILLQSCKGKWNWVRTDVKELDYGGKVWLPVFECSVCGVDIEILLQSCDVKELDYYVEKHCDGKWSDALDVGKLIINQPTVDAEGL